MQSCHFTYKIVEALILCVGSCCLLLCYCLVPIASHDQEKNWQTRSDRVDILNPKPKTLNPTEKWPNKSNLNLMKINLMVDEWLHVCKSMLKKKGPMTHHMTKILKKFQKTILSNNHPQEWRFFHENHSFLNKRILNRG